MNEAVFLNVGKKKKNCFITAAQCPPQNITCSNTWAKDGHGLTHHSWMEENVSDDADCSESLSPSMTHFFTYGVGTSPCMLFTAACP